MKKWTHDLHDGKHGAALTVRITPRSRHTEISDVLENGTLRIRVAAGTRDGEANRELINLLADVLGIDADRLEIVAGESGLDKIVSVLEMTSSDAGDRIQAWLEEAHEPSAE